MYGLLHGNFGRLGGALGRLAGGAAISLSLCGCASVWDEMSRKDIPVHARFSNLFTKDDPLVILRDSQDGDKRARALRALEEPQRHGGSTADQDAIVAIVVTAAKSDKQPLCRLAAVRKLGEFKDPRAAQGLIDAYYKATVFAPETATVIQCEALTALGQTKHPAGVELLTRVVRAPAPAFDVSSLEKQQEHDRRTAAARALANFSHYEATEALVHVLKNDRDIAMRNRAHESLVKITGKELPADGKEWENYLAQRSNEPPAREPASKINLTSLFKSE
ncbi:MAG: HEAT repeat domain-containing protein [Planctomycetia bacterium]|nr:HEAT repeat domain-containing protein [Planctomycetia bacterium]